MLSEARKKAEKYATNPTNMAGCPSLFKDILEHNRCNAFLAGYSEGLEAAAKELERATRVNEPYAVTSFVGLLVEKIRALKPASEKQGG